MPARRDWYGAWGNNFAAGSPQHNALSGVDTEEGTNPPTAFEIDTLTQSGTSFNVAYVAGGGRRAASLVLVWQVVGVDADFGLATPVILTGQTIGPCPAGATVNFKTIATNSAGTTESAVQTITLT